MICLDKIQKSCAKCGVQAKSCRTNFNGSRCRKCFNDHVESTPILQNDTQIEQPHENGEENAEIVEAASLGDEENPEVANATNHGRVSCNALLCPSKYALNR
jgi:hypothetical protein